MSNELSDEEREHLRAQAVEAKRQLSERLGEPAEPELSPEQEAEVARLSEEVRRLSDGDAGETQERTGAEEPGHGYDIRPASAEPEPEKEEIITAFLVFINADGKAIATSEIDKVLSATKRRREADIPDFNRACAEVVGDTNRILQTQSLINTQMQLAHQAQEAAKNQQLLQGLDLTKVKR